KRKNTMGVSPILPRRFGLTRSRAPYQIRALSAQVAQRVVRSRDCGALAKRSTQETGSERLDCNAPARRTGLAGMVPRNLGPGVPLVAARVHPVSDLPY